MNSSLRELSDIEYGASPKEIRADDKTSIGIYGTSGFLGHATRSLFNGPLVVVARKGTLDNPIYVEGDCWVIDTAFAVLPKADVDAKWLYYQLSNYDLKKLNESTGVPSISREYLYRLAFNNPGGRHQKKIARILTAIDEAIKQTEETIEKLKKIKQGMMRDLFTRGINVKTGKLRPAYSEAPELYKKTELGWIPKDWGIEHLYKLIIGNGIYGLNAPAVDYSPNLPTYLRITDISDDGYFIRAGRKSVVDQDYEQYFLNIGDIVFARTGASTGKSYLYDPQDGALVFAGFLIKFKPDKRFLLPGFLKCFTETYWYWTWVSSMSARTGQPGINAEEYASMRIFLPDVNEQGLIENKINEIKINILNCNQELIKYIRIKNGLMQDLLSGKVEVKPDFQDKEYQGAN